MKKLLVSILVLVLLMSGVCTVFAACSDPTDYDHTIVLLTNQGDAKFKLTQNAIERFEAKYPGWTVKHETQGDYNKIRNKIRQDFGTEQYPDLAYCYPDHVALYLQTRKVVNMSKYFDSTQTVKGIEIGADGTATGKEISYQVGFTADEQADFYAAFLDEGRANNFSGASKYGFADTDLVTMPFMRSTEALYYNKTALDACGLEPATTWDELWAQAATINALYPKTTLLGYDSEANWFITMCEQSGWGYTSIDEAEHFLFKENSDLANWLDDLGTKYSQGLVTSQSVYGGYTSSLFTSGPKPLKKDSNGNITSTNADGVVYATEEEFYADQGGIVYCIGSTGGASYQATSNFEWGVAPVPGVDGGNNHVISQGPSFVMFSGGYNVSNPEEKEMMTWLFLKELMDPTFQTAYSITSGYSPVRNSVYTNPTYLAELDKADESIISAVLKMSAGIRDRFFVSPAFKGSSTARDAVGEAIVSALKGEGGGGAELLIQAYKDAGGKN